MGKVLIIEDSEDLLFAISDIVERAGHKVFAAGTGQVGLELLESQLIDLVYLDIGLPDANGIDLINPIHEIAPDVDVVMLTASELDEHFQAAAEAGVAGYLLKNLDADELFDLIEGVERGEAAMTRAMAAKLLKSVADRAFDEKSGEEALTVREVEVLRLLARGDSNPQIAAELNITVNTVKTHISHILTKLHLENRTQAAAYAVEKRLTLPK